VPYPDQWLIPQWRTDRILLDRLTALGGDVEFDTELIGFHQDETGVTADLRRDGQVERRTADYLVGTDGGRSTVRKLGGFRFEGETDDTEPTLIGDVRADGVDGVACHMFTREGDPTERFSLWNLPGDRYYQFVAAVPADGEPELSVPALQEMLDKRSGRTDIRLHDLSWISVYRVNTRMVDRFRIGRVFVAGDAAHVHSSAGGQGLNTSIQDAYNLGWKLAAVLHGARPDLLDTYDEERAPVAANLLGLSSFFHRAGFRAERPPASSTPALHQLDITYRDRSLSVDDRQRPEGLCPGDRAPDASLVTRSGTAIRLFELFQGPHWTLLDFRPGEPAASASPGTPVHVHRIATGPTGSPGSTAALDTTGAAGRAYGVDFEQTFVLVRPDGYIALSTSRLPRLRQYIQRLGIDDTTNIPSEPAGVVT